jgi:hypothetical protein
MRLFLAMSPITGAEVEITSIHMPRPSKDIILPEWQLMYQVRWYGWILMTAYSIVVELFMSIISVSSLGLGFCLLLGWLPPGFDPSLGNLRWYQVVFVMVLAGWLGSQAVPGLWAEVVDLFAPNCTFEGPLDSIQVVVHPTKNGSYKAWQLCAGGEYLEIAFHDSSNRFEFERQVTAGRQVRLRYRRGTNLVTNLAVLKKRTFSQHENGKDLQLS